MSVYIVFRVPRSLREKVGAFFRAQGLAWDGGYDGDAFWAVSRDPLPQRRAWRLADLAALDGLVAQCQAV